MAEIKLYKTTAKGLKIIGMNLPFIVAGIWMITEKQYGTIPYIMGWIGICFFGLGIAVGIFQTFDKRPQIIINEDGIWDRTTKQDEVKWEQIIEAYPLEISGQKLISLVTDDTYNFKKKPPKWVSKINEFLEAQNLNLSLGQIKIDEIELANFINQLRTKNREERKRLIETFKVDSPDFSISDLKKAFMYVLISAALLIMSLSSITVFWIILIVSGIFGIIVRWGPGNRSLRKYAIIGVGLGFINLVLCLGTIKIYNHIANDVGEQLVIGIEEYKVQNTVFPADIKPVVEQLDLNFHKRYFADKVDYKTTDTDYELEADMLFGKRRKYDKKLYEWR